MFRKGENAFTLMELLVAIFFIGVFAIVVLSIFPLDSSNDEQINDIQTSANIKDYMK